MYLGGLGRYARLESVLFTGIPFGYRNLSLEAHPISLLKLVSVTLQADGVGICAELADRKA